MEHFLLPEAIKFISSGNPYSVFNLDDPFLISNHKHKDGSSQKGNIIVGQQESYYLLKPGRRYANFCIISKPAGLSRLLGLPINEITNDSVSLEMRVKKLSRATR